MLSKTLLVSPVFGSCLAVDCLLALIRAFCPVAEGVSDCSDGRFPFFS